MKQHLFLAVLYVIVAATGFTACQPNQKKEETVQQEAATLSVSPKGTVTFSANAEKVDIGGNQHTPLFTVSTNRDEWQAASDQEWLTINIDRENKQFTLSAQPNTDIARIRSASITVSLGDSLQIVLPITQECTGIEDSEYRPIALVVGHGYDVTQRFAYSPDIKGQVLDFMELYKNNLVKKDKNLRIGKFTTYKGNQSNEYTHSLAVSAGLKAEGGVKGLCYFQSEVTTQFNKSDYTKDSYAYATVQANIVRDAYFVEHYNNPAKLQKYISPTFADDLQNKPAAHLIQLYGTHVMLGGLWGARLDHHFSVKKKIKAYSDENQVDFKVRAEATIKGVTGAAEINSSVQKKYEECYDTSTEETNTQTYGGNPEQGMSIHTSQDYDSWINSIAGNEIWCNYYPETLIPIYELVANERLKNDLKKAYDEYLEGQTITVSSAKATATKRIPFQVQGGAVRIGGGDSDVNTQNGRHTDWKLNVNLIESYPNPKAEITLWVKEGAKNYTELQLDKTETIALNIPNYILNSNLKSWSSTKRSISGQTHGWNRITEDCPFLENVEIRIDGDGSDDQNVIGAKGYILVDYSYVK